MISILQMKSRPDQAPRVSAPSSLPRRRHQSHEFALPYSDVSCPTRNRPPNPHCLLYRCELQGFRIREWVAGFESLAALLARPTSRRTPAKGSLQLLSAEATSRALPPSQ